jgi:tRNA-dihydrouridine synthase 2
MSLFLCRRTITSFLSLAPSAHPSALPSTSPRHLRTIHERPQDPAHWSALRAIVDSVGIPVIANGDIFERADIERVCAKTGCSSVMIARAAQDNLSIFRAEGMLDRDEVIRGYIRKAVETDNLFQNTKYVLLQMAQPHTSVRRQKLLASRSMREVW